MEVNPAITRLGTTSAAFRNISKGRMSWPEKWRLVHLTFMITPRIKGNRMRLVAISK
jgi:hypothetical protein